MSIGRKTCSNMFPLPGATPSPKPERGNDKNRENL